MLRAGLRRPLASSRQGIHRPTAMRSFRPSSLWLSEEEPPAEASIDHAALKASRRAAALDFNRRRSIYKSQVSDLRRRYAEEVQQQRAADQAAQEALQREMTRRRLERQRLKNMKSAQNAIKQKELRELRQKEFEEHLKMEQIKRDAKHELYTKARQMVIDELEEEAPLWLTTPEEVEARFTPEAEQLLWARRGGVLGAPNPSLDSHYWRYETHTWQMRKTYKSQRELLLEELEEQAYQEANVDKSFWTPERIARAEEDEDRARLRAMVLSAGRSELLRQQSSMVREAQEVKPGELPKKPAPADYRVLDNEAAMEKEGVKILLDDPTRFFVFEKSGTDGVSADDPDAEDASSYAGPTLGAPIGLRDPLRENNHQGTVFPYMVGKFPKPDTRTEREKKKQAREERLFAAAQIEASDDVDSVDLAAEDRDASDLMPDLDYDTLQWDSDDEEWEKGLDPEGDEDIKATHPELRYSAEDVDWVIEQLEGKARHFERQTDRDLDALKQKTRYQLEMEKEKAGEGPLSEDDVYAKLLSLSNEELIVLSDLDEAFTTMSPEEFSVASKAITSLTESEVRTILDQHQAELHDT